MGGVLLNAHTLGETYLSFLHISHLRGGEIYTWLLLCRCSVSTAVSHLCHNSTTVYLQHFSYSEARLADKRNINRELVAQYHDIYKQQLCNSADGRLSF